MPVGSLSGASQVKRVSPGDPEWKNELTNVPMDGKLKNV